jgi:hypothetical protein
MFSSPILNLNLSPKGLYFFTLNEAQTEGNLHFQPIVLSISSFYTLILKGILGVWGKRMFLEDCSSHPPVFFSTPRVSLNAPKKKGRITRAVFLHRFSTPYVQIFRSNFSFKKDGSQDPYFFVQFF